MFARRVPVQLCDSALKTLVSEWRVTSDSRVLRSDHSRDVPKMLGALLVDDTAPKTTLQWPALLASLPTTSAMALNLDARSKRESPRCRDQTTSGPP